MLNVFFKKLFCPKNNEKNETAIKIVIQKINNNYKPCTQCDLVSPFAIIIIVITKNRLFYYATLYIHTLYGKAINNFNALIYNYNRYDLYKLDVDILISLYVYLYP